MVCASNGLTRFNNVYDFFPCLSSSYEEIDPEGAVNMKSRSIDRERPTLRATVKVRRPSSGSQYVYIGNKASVPNQVQMQESGQQKGEYCLPVMPTYFHVRFRRVK